MNTKPQQYAYDVQLVEPDAPCTHVSDELDQMTKRITSMELGSVNKSSDLVTDSRI